MSNEISTIDFNELPTSIVNFNEFASSAYLKRLQLVGKGKYIDEGKIRPGHWGVPTSATEIVDLGPEIDILPLAVRNKVLDTNVSPPIAVYDTAHPEYQRIRQEASGKDSGCMFGPSFLVFERSTGQLYELFMGNASGREESKVLEPFLPVPAQLAAKFNVEAHGPLPCTLKSKYVKRKHSWHAPVIVKCSEPITNLPEAETVRAEIIKFLSAKIDGVDEEVAEGERSR